MLHFSAASQGPTVDCCPPIRNKVRRRPQMLMCTDTSIKSFSIDGLSSCSFWILSCPCGSTCSIFRILLNNLSRRFALLALLIHQNSGYLRNTDTSKEEVHSSQSRALLIRFRSRMMERIQKISGFNNETPPRPDYTGGRESNVLSKRQAFCWSGEITNTGKNNTPLVKVNCDCAVKGVDILLS